LTLGRRGYAVTLADAAREFGGRLRFETRLPGLATWGRVRDWRLSQLAQLSNVTLYPGNELDDDQILGLEHTHVVVATGARWSRMLYSAMEVPSTELDVPGVYTPDDVAAGATLEAPVVVFDFDNYYLGGALALHLAAVALPVSYVTPAGHASAWTIMTNEQPQVHRALAHANVALHTLSRVDGFDGATAIVRNQFTDVETRLPCRSLLIVGLRRPNDALYHALAARDLKTANIASVTCIGDASAPGAIVHAVHSGHRYARALDMPEEDLYRRDAPISDVAARIYAADP
jgi:dimethylamine/trimethylamine dehydrogenase